MILRLLICLGLTSICSLSWAVVTNISINPSTVSGVDSTDATNIMVFGGIVGPIGACTTPDGTNTCNSCTAMTKFCPEAAPYRCAERSIYPALDLVITMVVDTLPTTPAIAAKTEPSGGSTVNMDNPTPAPVPVVGQPFTIRIKWSELCLKAGLTATCSATASSAGGNIIIYVGVSDGTNLFSGAYQKLTVKVSAQDPTLTPALVTIGTTDAGFFDFSVLPGDQKVYVNDVRRGAIGPTFPLDNSLIRWQALRVYFAQTAAPPAIPDFCIPLTADNFDDLAVVDKGTIETKLSTRKVSGLENDQTYMFSIASVDEASIVSSFTKPSTLAAAPIGHTATPGQVVGLLDDKNCFIATAAFGSQMDPEVQLLRKFRNQFFFNNFMGRKFIHTYYEFSPPIAAFISQHEALRAGVRFSLWPLIWFAEIALHLGFTSACLIFFATWFLLLATAQLLRRGLT